MLTNKTFMKICDYERMKHGITILRLCEDIGISRKDYGYFQKGIKTPPAGVVVELVKYFGLGCF